MGWRLGLAAGAIATMVVAGASAWAQQTTTASGQCPDGDSRTTAVLGVPTDGNLDVFRLSLMRFVMNRCYGPDALDWKHDKHVRDTGPYVDGVYYGTHPAVLMYYSPEVYDWLKGGRTGEIPDGAIIVKEMFTPPAARYFADGEWRTPADPDKGWTIMVKSASQSYDGWLWAGYDLGQKIEPQVTGVGYSGYGDTLFGRSCQNCHVLAENESTFSDLENIEGEEGEPATFYDDGSWIVFGDKLEEAMSPQHVGANVAVAAPPTPVANEGFLKQFPQFGVLSPDDFQTLPGEYFDHVPADARSTRQYLTSDQCFICHDGQNWALLDNMMLNPHAAPDQQINLGQWGEWRWSMMGLAGRDPIFYAQLESEIALHDAPPTQTDEADEKDPYLSPAAIQDTCLRCHGVMGQRQFHLDVGADTPFTLDHMFGAGPASHDQARWGALGRDGISCMTCHQMQPFTFAEIDKYDTGKFAVTPRTPGQPLPIYGPFDKPVAHAMKAGFDLEAQPSPDNFLQSSLMCGSCHTIFLPVLDENNRVIGGGYEQATFLEWVNSAFNTSEKDFKSCQDCHMPTHYRGNTEPLAFKVANIQDSTFPVASHIVPYDKRAVPVRENFARHTLLGINLFGMEMFNQFNDVLGVRLDNVETGGKYDLAHSIDNATYLARNESAKVDVVAETSGSTVTATVTVTNLTGHRFPSGVGFRRAFLEVVALDDGNNVIWGSGRTNGQGVIVGADGKTPLTSEFFDVVSNPDQFYEPHYERIDSQDKVQIYQELVQDPEKRFTTSFLSIAHHIKDNRLLPLGWTEQGPETFDGTPFAGTKYAKATQPRGNASTDQDFTDGEGHDVIRYEIALPETTDMSKVTIRARLYYQAIPPYYLQQRFTDARGSQTKRLYYLASHLETGPDGPIADWKVLTGSDAVSAMPPQ